MKNTLIFVPLILAHHVFDAAKVTAVLMAFAAFCLVASGGYVLNDLLDLSADRQHPHKMHRPFASGALSVRAGAVGFFLLVASSAAVALLGKLPPSFLALLVVYLVATVTYSAYFKRKLLLDVMLLASLYTLRILAGGEAAQVAVSAWLLAFSMFMFLSLAFVKRYTELRLVLAGNGQQALGRNYRIDELDLILTCGATSGFLAVLVLAMYISGEDVRRYYRNVNVLWTMCPLLLYWILRIWFLAKRGKLEGDPVAFAIRDRNSLLTAGLTILIFAVASAWRL